MVPFFTEVCTLSRWCDFFREVRFVELGAFFREVRFVERCVFREQFILLARIAGHGFRPLTLFSSKIMKFL